MEKNDELYHYASQYYDPVKAHEYYMEHRELKGRSTGMSDTQREGWTYAKKQIDTAKAKEKESEKNQYKSNIRQMKERAEQVRQSIVAEVKRKAEFIKKQLDKQTKNLKMPDKSDKLPAYARSYQQKVLANKRSAATKNAQRDLSKLSENQSTQLSDLSTALSSVIEQVRSDYKNKLSGIDSKYENIADAEYANIKTHLPGKVASKSSSSSSTSKTDSDGESAKIANIRKMLEERRQQCNK